MCDDVSDFQTHLLAPESKGVLNTYTRRWGYVKGTQDPAPNGQSWNNLSKNTNNILLGYNPKCKININELILI